jgi:hypothetical protein
MTYSKRLSRLEARSALREPIEQMLIFTTFVAPDGSAVADYVILDEEGITIRRRFDESAEGFIERVRAEVRLIHKNKNVRGKAPVRAIVIQTNWYCSQSTAGTKAIRAELKGRVS